MKKLFTLLTLVSMLFVGSMNMIAQTNRVVLAYGSMNLTSDGVANSDGKTYNNVLTGKEVQNNGFKMWLNADKKAYSSAQKITAKIDGSSYSYTTIKPSNGAPNVITIPEGIKVKKVTLVSYVNYDIAAKGKEGRLSYWKQIGDKNYTEGDAQIMNCWIARTENKKPVYTADPDVCVFDEVNAENELIITQTGEQSCFFAFLECVQSVSISDAKYATCITNRNLDFTGTDVTAYTVSAVGETTITLAKAEKVAAGQAVIVSAAAGGTYEIPTTSEELSEGINLMTYSAEETPVTEGGYYVVANGDNGVGFYPVNAGTAIPAGKGFIKVEGEASNAKAFLGFGFDGETTGINEVKTAGSKTGEIYNLNGQRVAAPAKGLYIMNGKKVVIK